MKLFLSARRCVGKASALVLACALLIAVSPVARAVTIERVVSPGGIEAWLVRSPAPMIALEFSILGSADQDPADKPGLSYMAASLLDEGAGPYDAMAFHERLESRAIELSFRAGRDYLRGTLRTLKENSDAAFDYLRLALVEPRFDAESVDRIRAQILFRQRRDIGSHIAHAS